MPSASRDGRDDERDLREEPGAEDHDGQAGAEAVAAGIDGGGSTAMPWGPTSTRGGREAVMRR